VDGDIFLCSDTELDCGHVGRRIPDAIMNDLESVGSYSGLSRLNGIYEDPRYVAALPVPAPDGSILAYVFAASNASSILRAWNLLLQIFLMISFGILLLSLVLSYVVAWVRARPINEMAEAALKFAHGDFSARVTESDRNDEIGALAASFNQMAAALEQSEQRRSDFVANVAHELKTPMTTISGFADGILDGTIPPERQAQYLNTISVETKRLNRLVRSMLELSRIQSAGPETLLQKSFDALDVLTKTLVLFEQKITALRLNVDLSIPENPMLVYGDADAITQVIYNLLENAIKFSSPGGELGVGLFKSGKRRIFPSKTTGRPFPPRSSR
jgi:signal transduction histidine kinase